MTSREATARPKAGSGAKRKGAETRERRARNPNAGRVERIHRAVAAFPLDVLEQVPRLEKPIARVRKLQDQSITATYALVRGVRREVAELLREPQRARRAKPRAPKAARTRKPKAVVREAKTVHVREAAAQAS